MINIPVGLQWAIGIIATILGMVLIGAAIDYFTEGDGYGCNDGGEGDDEDG